MLRGPIPGATRETSVPSDEFGLQNLLKFFMENETGNQIKQLNNAKARRKETKPGFNKTCQ